MKTFTHVNEGFGLFVLTLLFIFVENKFLLSLSSTFRNLLEYGEEMSSFL